MRFFLPDIAKISKSHNKLASNGLSINIKIFRGTVRGKKRMYISKDLYKYTRVFFIFINGFEVISAWKINGSDHFSHDMLKKTLNGFL